MKNKNEMLAKYDFTGKKAVRGKYAKSFNDGHSVRIFDGDKLVSEDFFAAIEPDVREFFPDSESINRALRALITIIPARPAVAHKN